MAIYIASKTKHADKWRRIAKLHAVNSTWIYEAGEGETSDFHDLWRRCMNESKTCTAMVVYREPDDILKGAWMEMGAAISHNIPVHAVGLEEFTIGKSKFVTHHPNIDAAIQAAAACA